MAKLLQPEDGFLFNPHTSLQEAFIDRIHRDGITDALQWLREVKANQERSLPRGITFRWKPEGEHAHQLELSESPDFSHSFSWNTQENSLFLDNFKTDTCYFWRVDGSQPRQFRTAALHPRFIRLEGALNVRDIGGNLIRQGLVYRGSAIDAPFGITEAGSREFREHLGIKTELELRMDGDPGPSAVPGVRKITIPYRPYLEVFEPRHKDGLRQIFALLAREEIYPIYIHCMGGADRTGMIALFLRALLGESDDDIHLDYELTALSTYAAGAKEGADGFRSRFAPYYRAFLEQLASYGQPLAVAVPAFLRSCGIPQDQLDTIRQILRRS